MSLGIDQVIAVIVGIATPFITNLIKQSTWKGWVIQLVVFGFAIAVAVVSSLIVGGLDWGDVVASVGIIFGLSEGIYRQFIKKE